ncbi:MAG: hypothetical protein LBI92_07895 [Azoarcus sp.]|jgi:diacylglycerol kinase family enzyme|nr:hypothetical protein [Azoarcus sp.]
MTTTIAPARHFFVVNPICFRRRQDMDDVIGGIHHFFAAAGSQAKHVEYAVHVSRFPRDAIGAIRRYANSLPEGAPLRVYAVGGGGTLFDCLNGVVGLPNAELGSLPYGKENNFYRGFNCPDVTIFRALDVQTSAASVPMDTLHCGSNHSLSYCLIGLESVANARAKMMYEQSMWMRHLLPSLRRLLQVGYGLAAMCSRNDVSKQDYQMWVDDEEWSGRYVSINIANSPWFAGGHRAVPEADPADGLLDVLMSSVKKKMQMPYAMWQYMRGSHNLHPEFFSHKRAKRVFVTSGNPLVLDLDGEVFYDKHITVAVKPAAVRVIAPVVAEVPSHE